MATNLPAWVEAWGGVTHKEGSFAVKGASMGATKGSYILVLSAELSLL